MSYQLMFQKAVELHQNGALNEAEQIYRQILETAPQNADILNLLGLIAQAKGIHYEAVNYFYKAVDYAPKHFPIYFNLAVSLGALGRYVEAIEAYRKVLELKSDCKEAYLGLGNLYWAQNKTDDAKQAFQNALNIDNDYTEAKTNLAELNNDTETLQKISSGNPQALFYLGRRAFKARKNDNSLEYLQKADNLIADSEIKTLLGEVLLSQKRNNEALQKFYQAVQINEHNITALVNIADLETQNRNFKEAEKYYHKAIETDGKNLRAHANYANMLCQNKRTLEALEEYRNAVIISPQSPELSYNLALILKTLEEYEQALDLMFHAFYLDSSHTEWSLNIAETLIMFNEKAPEKAKKICENWYEKMPDNIVVKHLWSAINHQIPDNEEEYNRLLFDNFAENYEKTLQNINYSVVDKITELHSPFKGKILDLGCGTGLLGTKIKTDENKIIGIDISANMLKIAAEKNVYEQLENCNISEYLQNKHPDFDCVIAADVFCYFGDLKPIVKAICPTRLIFSIESDENIQEYTLQANGRYKHNPEYIKQTLQNSGYAHIQSSAEVLRQENGHNVNGYIFEAEL
ncbi:MAG: tetratricopeptide repeat protein [Alphaproteobacteria bacterium]|nr:tetratricopeptide repeat protein [Alphaproteobacteria bacterium]